MNNIILVFIGGGIGSVLRYAVSFAVKNYYNHVFPLATLVSNFLSCVILGFVVGVMAQRMEAAPSLKLFLIVGICGGFSTFSTFSYETVELIKQENYLYAGLNILVSTITCVGIVYFLSKNSSAF